MGELIRWCRANLLKIVENVYEQDLHFDVWACAVNSDSKRS